VVGMMLVWKQRGREILLALCDSSCPASHWGQHASQGSPVMQPPLHLSAVWLQNLLLCLSLQRCLSGAM